MKKLDKGKFILLDGRKEVPGGCPIYYPDCPLENRLDKVCIYIGFLYGENLKQCYYLEIDGNDFYCRQGY